ncbi:MAG: ATP-binding protein [Alphaproteobacteria bacterium]|nr:ATP-binding protein [Alphaproteobacteria bacterium]
MTANFKQLTNVRNFNNLMQRVIANEGSTSTFACFYGASGVGKTTSAIWAMNYHRAKYIEVGASWTKRTLIENLAKQFSIQKIKSIPDGVAQIIDALHAEIRPIIIDEADYLIDGLKVPKIELIREIRDATNCPVILLGEGQLPANLMPIERVYNRVLDWVVAERADEADTLSLIDAYAPNITFSDDLANAINVRTKGITRKIENEVKKVANYCLAHDMAEMDLPTFLQEIGFTPNHAKMGGSANQ